MYKQAPKSPAMKALVGNQKNLPQALKAQIEASPAKNMNKGYGSPAKLAPGETNKKAAPKPKYDKELNTLVASRKGLKKGTAEYNTIQNKINAKLGSKKVHGRGTETAAALPRKTYTQSHLDLKHNAAVDSGLSPQGGFDIPGAIARDIAKAKPEVKASKPKANISKVKQTPGKTTLTVKTNGGANKGGTTKKETVTRNKKKVVIKDGDTRTVIKRDNKGARITDTKTTKRVGAKIKGAIKTAKLNRLDRVAKKQAAKAKGSGKKPGSKTEIFG